MSLAVSGIVEKSQTPHAPFTTSRPVLLLTIKNGAAHTQAAEAIAEALEFQNILCEIVDVSDFMSALARFTHVSAYLWLVKNAPRVWEKIDAHQKKQTQTSPEWFYRRQCRKLFDLARKIQPSAIVATEVGCNEIAALIKRELNLAAPLVAVNLDYEADRAWIQTETDFYSVAADFVKTDLVKLGAESEKIVVLGVPLKSQFASLNETKRAQQREKFCEEYDFDAGLPIILVAGGGEGLGKIQQITKRLLELKTQTVTLCGNNQKLRNACEELAESYGNLRVFGWTNRVAEFYTIADVLISKLGLTFFEATACGLPIIALPPPPGAERVQYDLLEKFGVGRAVETLDEMTQVVEELLKVPKIIDEMRLHMTSFNRTNAAEEIAVWIRERILPERALSKEIFV